uniref:Putative ovule protein n=1 Tax=Solanum chacoense TaxID=4108 RepID=A0A0V0H1Y7_SOLCH
MSKMLHCQCVLTILVLKILTDSFIGFVTQHTPFQLKIPISEIWLGTGYPGINYLGISYPGITYPITMV